MNSEKDWSWGYVVYEDGSRAPLKEPKSLIPEDEREIIIDRPGLCMWTQKNRDANA